MLSSHNNRCIGEMTPAQVHHCTSDRRFETQYKPKGVPHMASLHRYKVQMTLLQTLFTPVLHPLHNQCLCGVTSTIKILVGYVEYEFNGECGLLSSVMYRKYLISALQPRYSSVLADIPDRNGKGNLNHHVFTN